MKKKIMVCFWCWILSHHVSKDEKEWGGEEDEEDFEDEDEEGAGDEEEEEFEEDYEGAPVDEDGKNVL